MNLIVFVGLKFIAVDGFPAAASKEDGAQFYQGVLSEMEKVARQLQAE